MDKNSFHNSIPTINGNQNIPLQLCDLEEELLSEPLHGGYLNTVCK